MDQKAHIGYMLGRSRWMTEQLLESFKTDDDWFYQPHPQANFALWIVAHLGLADNAFASRFRPDRGSKPDGWDELFWFGSELKDDRSAYPSPAEVLAYFKERREVLLSVVEELTEDELNAEAPGPDERSPIAGAPNLGHLLMFAAYHEGVHTGQLTVAHRGLGHKPIVG